MSPLTSFTIWPDLMEHAKDFQEVTPWIVETSLVCLCQLLGSFSHTRWGGSLIQIWTCCTLSIVPELVQL